MFQDFPSNHVSQGLGGLAVGQVGLDQPLRPSLPQTCHSSSQGPPPEVQGHLPPACPGLWKEVRDSRTPRVGSWWSGRILQPWAPQPCPPPLGRLLFSVAGEAVQAELPRPDLEASLLWETATRKLFPGHFFILFLFALGPRVVPTSFPR